MPKRSLRSSPAACTPSVSVAWWPAHTMDMPSSRASARKSSCGSPVSSASAPIAAASSAIPPGLPEQIASVRRRSGPPGERDRNAARDLCDALGQGLQRDGSRKRPVHGQRDPAVLREPPADAQAQLLRETRVVADALVPVERKVVGGKRDVGREQPLEPPAHVRTDRARLVVPEHAVVDEQHLRALDGGPIEHLERRRHGSRHALDPLGADHLHPDGRVIAVAMCLELRVEECQDLVALCAHGWLPGPRCGPGSASGCPDSNWGPLRPERSALPGCATPRKRQLSHTAIWPARVRTAPEAHDLYLLPTGTRE